MIQNLSIFQIAGGLARHSAARQTVIAQNLANMDTPGYKARDLASFEQHLARSGQNGGAENALKTTRNTHIAMSSPGGNYDIRADNSMEQKPNGNSVSLEGETLKAIEAERAHSRALAVYQSSLSLLKSSIGRGR